MRGKSLTEIHKLIKTAEDLTNFSVSSMLQLCLNIFKDIGYIPTHQTKNSMQFRKNTDCDLTITCAYQDVLNRFDVNFFYKEHLIHFTTIEFRDLKVNKFPYGHYGKPERKNVYLPFKTPIDLHSDFLTFNEKLQELM